MILPSSLQKQIDEAAEEYQRDDNRTKIGPKNSFKSGADFMFKTLSEMGGEWRFEAAKYYAEGLSHIQEQGATYTFADGARYQHSLMSAQIEALKELLNSSVILLKDRDSRIQELEAENAKLKASVKD